MGRFRRGSKGIDGERLLARLPRAFTLDELLRAVGEDEIAGALNWLYAGVERGEIVPSIDDFPIVYQVAGRSPGPRDPAAA